MSAETQRLFDQLTEDANKLLDNEEYNVYHDKQEVFQREAEGYERLAVAQGRTSTSASQEERDFNAKKGLLPDVTNIGATTSSAAITNVAGSNPNASSAGNPSNGDAVYDMFADDDDDNATDKPASNNFDSRPNTDRVGQLSSDGTQCSSEAGTSETDYVFDEASGYYYSSSTGKGGLLRVDSSHCLSEAAEPYSTVSDASPKARPRPPSPSYLCFPVAPSGSSLSSVNSPYLWSRSSLQDQLFRVHDFSPKWAWANSVTEVHVIGKFLMDQEDVMEYQWSCMFGEIEVPAQILVDGVLCCYAPAHHAAVVSFCVTCSNEACSEIRSFVFRPCCIEDAEITSIHGCSQNEINLHQQLEKLLSLKSLNQPNSIFDGAAEKQQIIKDIISSEEEQEDNFMVCSLEGGLSEEDFLEKLIKQKLYSWLHHEVIESGAGPRVLDGKGQGLLHLVAALGYDWAIKPTLVAGVSVDFPDVNGWTGLHWAAFYGRERTVALLLSVDAAPGTLTNPSSEFPLGQTPADVAFDKGHRGIAGFLAESALTSYYSLLTKNDPEHATKVVLTFSERKPTSWTCDNSMLDQYVLPVKDTLSGIFNATQAAHRTFQIFRIRSFQRKKIEDGRTYVVNNSDKPKTLSMATRRRKLAYFCGFSHGTAMKIHKTSRWKKRKRYQLCPRRKMACQASNRGIQQTEHYMEFVRSETILEKIVLRSRRKGSGLRRFNPRPFAIDSYPQCILSYEEDYDFLKEGSSQNEERIENALGRVTSMIRHQVWQAQYSRLLMAVSTFCLLKDKRTEYSPTRSHAASCNSHSNSFAGSRHSRSSSFSGSCVEEPRGCKDSGSETGTPLPFHLEDTDLAHGHKDNSSCASFLESSWLPNPVSNTANAVISSSSFPISVPELADACESQPSIHGRSPTPHDELDTGTNSSISQDSECREEVVGRDLWIHNSYLSTSTSSSSTSRTGGTLHIQI